LGWLPVPLLNKNSRNHGSFFCLQNPSNLFLLL
jgi:hypothetical protein